MAKNQKKQFKFGNEIQAAILLLLIIAAGYFVYKEGKAEQSFGLTYVTAQVFDKGMSLIDEGPKSMAVIGSYHGAAYVKFTTRVTNVGNLPLNASFNSTSYCGSGSPCSTKLASSHTNQGCGTIGKAPCAVAVGQYADIVSGMFCVDNDNCDTGGREYEGANETFNFRIDAAYYDPVTKTNKKMQATISYPMAIGSEDPGTSVSIGYSISSCSWPNEYCDAGNPCCSGLTCATGQPRYIHWNSASNNPNFYCPQEYLYCELWREVDGLVDTCLPVQQCSFASSPGRGNNGIGLKSVNCFSPEALTGPATKTCPSGTPTCMWIITDCDSATSDGQAVAYSTRAICDPTRHYCKGLMKGGDSDTVVCTSSHGNPGMIFYKASAYSSWIYINCFNYPKLTCSAASYPCKCDSGYCCIPNIERDCGASCAAEEVPFCI